MVADGLPCSLVLINDSTVKIVVTACENVERSEDLESHFMAILDEVSEHIVVTCSLYSFPVAHVWSDLAVVKDFAHDGLHIDNDIAESQILALLKIELNRVRMRKCRIVCLAVEPHIIVIGFGHFSL